MAQLTEFETALKEVVYAKRLSASKMNNLTEVALKSMQDDTQLVSILYRTHKSLQPAAKVSSLYVFDALARAARTQVVKQRLTGDINSVKGNCATFLLKVEGVLEGLVQDMLSISTPESKEKTKKVLDIWSKGSTFPPAILVRLKDLLSETEKDNAVKITSDPRSAAVITPPVVAPLPSAPPAPVLDPQATLLALLTQAASAAQANPGQTPANTPGAAQQLAVLQQLALTANRGNVAQNANSMMSGYPNGALRSPAPHRDEQYAAAPGMGRRDSRFERGNSQELGRNYEDQNNFRGGFRGRGRGEGRGWDDRGDRYNRDVDRSPPRRVRSSRSRSPGPSRYNGRRDVKPYSPPRRPSIASMPSQEVNRDRAPAPAGRAPPEAGKDEFGRDVRPASPEPEPSASASANIIPTQPPPPPPVVVRTQTVEPPPAALTSNHVQMSLTPSVDANTSSRAAPDAVVVSNEIPSQQGLENFSLATFDFTAPSSWEALGKMWQVTHGHPPSQQQLMQFVMSGGAVASQQPMLPMQQLQQQADWGGGGSAYGAYSMGPQPRRGARGRGGFSRGRGGGNFARDGQDRWSNMGETDAIVLGGGDMDTVMDETTNAASPPQENGGGLGGRMQRVGEKWVFVRDPVTNES
ncbi:hypothetical protein B0H16DRAFT_1534769 [Mycena metata]|uniref:CID domain-containing protein n=1 Tax=Mycena metata TaxID=1033252 RepID=A0AAD7NG04_9AGAR|nr:hypothetical protein B0H16DRAFT_1534769 [Mycena metata]